MRKIRGLLLFTLFTPLLIHAQVKVYPVTYMKTVTGRVINDSTGEPVMGASVEAKGTGAGATTGSSGTFSFQVPATVTTLVITSVGFKEREVAIGSAQLIRLIPVGVSMNDVIVVGYGVKKKETLTGAIYQVGPEVFKDRPVPNVEQALQGEIPGLLITRTSTRPGNEGLAIVLRGASSVVATDPLIIVDGVPTLGTWEISQLNPNDIESVTVLKDASAAIYGARAQGGVILVTTKRGKGRMSVNFRSNADLNTIGIHVPWAHMNQWAALYLQTSYSDKRDASGNPVQWLPQWTNANLEAMAKDSSFDYTDPNGLVHHYADNNWQSALYAPSWSEQQNVSISGSSGKTAYMLSAGYSNNQSVLKTAYDGEKKYNIRFNYDYNITDRIKFQTGVSYDDRVVQSPRNGVGTGYFDAPIFPVYNKLGQYYDDYGYRNPVAFTTSGGTTKNSQGIFRLNGTLSAEIISGLKLSATAAVTKNDGWMTAYNQTFNFYNWLGTMITNTQYGPPNNPSITETVNDALYQTYGGQVDYNKTIAGKHNISLMVGNTAELYQTKTVSATRSQLQFPGLYDLNTAISPTTVSYSSENSGGDSHWGFISYIGRFNYDYKKKYLLEVLGRRDGSSKFDVSNRWSNFYDVSVGWRLLQEPFLHALTPYVNELKVRADYGETGGQANIGNYDYLAVVSLGTALFGSTPGMETSSNANAIVTDQRTWERMRNKNLGIDFGVLQNRLTGSLDFFEKQNIGMLISLVYPSILGGTAPTTNSGTLRTRGWELALAWKDKAGPVTYNVGFVLSDAHNVVTSYAGANTWAAGNYTTPRVGYPLNQLYVYKTDGYFKTQAEADAYFAKYGASGNAAGYDGATNTFHPGDLKVVDLDGDGKITANGTGQKGSGDVYYYGDADPHYSFGLNLGASWKGFDFSTFIQGVAKWNILRTGNARAPFFRNYLNVNTTYIGKTYTAQNPNAPYPRLSFDNSINNWNWQYNDVNIQHLRYARLKTLVLGYTLPVSWAARIKATRIRFYFSANDLWEITSVKDGFDPERGNSSDSSYPFMRTKSFGLDLGF